MTCKILCIRTKTKNSHIFLTLTVFIFGQLWHEMPKNDKNVGYYIFNSTQLQTTHKYVVGVLPFCEAYF